MTATTTTTTTRLPETFEEIRAIAAKALEDPRAVTCNVKASFGEVTVDRNLEIWAA